MLYNTNTGDLFCKEYFFCIFSECFAQSIFVTLVYVSEIWD